MVTKREFNRIKKQNPESRIGQRTRKEQKLRNELAKILIKAREEGIDTTTDEYTKKLLKLAKEEQQKVNDINKLEEKRKRTEQELERREIELGRIKGEIGKLKEKEAELTDKEKEIEKKDEFLKEKEIILSKKELRIKSKLHEVGISESEFSEDGKKDLEELMMEELLEYRENRKMNVKGISDKIKEKIIENASKIDVKFGLTKEGIKKIHIKLKREGPYYGTGEREYIFYDPTYKIGGEMGYEGHREMNDPEEIKRFLLDLSILIHRGNESNDNDDLAFAMYLTGINWGCRASKILERNMNHYKYRATTAERNANHYPDPDYY